MRDYCEPLAVSWKSCPSRLWVFLDAVRSTYSMFLLAAHCFTRLLWIQRCRWRFSRGSCFVWGWNALVRTRQAHRNLLKLYTAKSLINVVLRWCTSPPVVDGDRCKVQALGTATDVVFFNHACHQGKTSLVKSGRSSSLAPSAGSLGGLAWPPQLTQLKNQKVFNTGRKENQASQRYDRMQPRGRF